jgi:cell wall-associated NlpC family hydrolase
MLMNRRSIVPLLPLVLGTASVLESQSTTLSSYVAADGAVSGVPVLLGLTVGRESSYLGIRWSTGVDATSTFAGSDGTSADGLSGLFTSEVDARLFPLGSRNRLDLNPYGFAGVGLRLSRDGSAASPEALWSYGGGMRMPVSNRLSLEAEVRNRRPISGDAAGMPHGTAPGMEYRVGLSVRIGRTGDGGAMRPTGTLASALASGAYGLSIRAPAGASASEAARFAVARRAIDAADDHLGVPYRWGGNSPREGFDCSGFVRYVFAGQGYELPRVSRDQARVGEPVPLDLGRFQPGDLLAFASNGRTVDHIAIYVGGGRIIHSSSSGGGVRYDDLTNQRGSWYMRHMVAARRFIR